MGHNILPAVVSVSNTLKLVFFAIDSESSLHCEAWRKGDAHKLSAAKLDGTVGESIAGEDTFHSQAAAPFAKSSNEEAAFFVELKHVFVGNPDAQSIFVPSVGVSFVFGHFVFDLAVGSAHRELHAEAHAAKNLGDDNKSVHDIPLGVPRPNVPALCVGRRFGWLYAELLHRKRLHFGCGFGESDLASGFGRGWG